jgi:hypothetical protein
MRRHGRELVMMGRRDLKTASEALETTEVTLVAGECLRGPRMGHIYHPHPFQHHKGHHHAARG